MSDKFQDRLETFMKLTRQGARAHAESPKQGWRSHHLAAHEDAEAALRELFSPHVRDKADDLIGQVFWRMSEIEALDVKRLRPLRLTSESKIKSQIAEHEAAIPAVIAELKALR